MPELHVQRREGLPGWIWPMTALLAAFMIWWMASAARVNRTTTATEPQERVAGERQVMIDDTGDASLPVGLIMTEPKQHMGTIITGTAIVADQPTPTGMWLEADGRKVFAVIDGPVPETLRLRRGQVVRLSGEVMDKTRFADIPEIATLRPDTRSVLDDQKAFLYVDGERIELLGPNLIEQPAGKSTE